MSKSRDLANLLNIVATDTELSQVSASVSSLSSVVDTKASMSYVESLNSGNIVQVVQRINDTGYTRSSASSIANVTNFYAQITPKYNNSKILALVQCSGYIICDGFWYLMRDGVNVRTMASSPRVDFIYDDPSWFMSYLDSPATTSQITYYIAANGTGCGQTINVNANGGKSNITLLEVAS